MSNSHTLVPLERIQQAILQMREQKVILDADLAVLYGVATKVLVQAIRRNKVRFPPDFMFQLSPTEFKILRSQSVTSSQWGGRRYPPYAFAEQGVAMLSGLLNSPRAIQANITIMRAFVQLRRMLATHADLARKLEEMERKYDRQFQVVFEAMRRLMAPPEKHRKEIGFKVKERPSKYKIRKGKRP
jgi:hypothetical protein